MTLPEKIKGLISGEVAGDEATLEKYSRDASLFSVRPEVVVFPKDSEDVKKIVKLAAAEKAAGSNVSLTARSAGTDMTGGPLGESVILDFTRHFNRVLEVGEEYAVTEPGVYYRDFEKETLKRGFLLPSYPASRELCALGGMVANNSGGEKTLSYGKTEKYVERIKAVLRDGEEHIFQAVNAAELEEKKKIPGLEGEIYTRIYTLLEENYDKIQAARPQVSKNSAGYYLWNVWDRERGTFDLTKLFTGSQGTLGLLTEIKLKLIKPKPHSRMLVIFLKSTEKLGEIVNHFLSFRPESLESYDDHTFRVALKFFPDVAVRLKDNLLSLAWKFLPEFWAVLTGGIPKMIILAEFTDETENAAYARAREAEESLQEFSFKTKVTKNEKEAQKYWVVRRESFNLLRRHTRGLRTAPFIDDLIVRPEKLPEFLPRLYKILDEHRGLIYTVAGHVGDGNFHIIPLMDLRKEENRKTIFELSEKVYQLVLDFGGSLTAEHNDGLIRTPYLEKMYGPEMVRLFAQVKNIFDPENLFNPHKKVGSDLNYAEKHLSFS